MMTEAPLEVVRVPTAEIRLDTCHGCRQPAPIVFYVPMFDIWVCERCVFEMSFCLVTKSPEDSVTKNV